MSIEGPGVAGVVKAIDSQTVASTGSVYSPWYDASHGESFSVWAKVYSAAGAVDVNVFIDLSPFSSTISQTSTDTTLYVAHKLVDALSTESQLMGPYHANNNADNKVHLDYPFMQWRIRVAGDGSNSADTVADVWVVRFN